MNSKYKIEVDMTPHYQDSKNKPYYWAVFNFDDYNIKWLNIGEGKAITPDEAWKEAQEFYYDYCTLEGE